jgi:hypothetical protein
MKQSASLPPYLVGSILRINDPLDGPRTPRKR